MSNTALYQCEKCGYSSNNPVAFDIHPCRPSNGVNWNSRFVAIALAMLLTLAALLPAKAEDAPPSVGEPPTIAVEHRMFLPFVAAPEDEPTGQGRYWGGLSNPNVSWCPSCRG